MHNDILGPPPTQAQQPQPPPCSGITSALLRSSSSSLHAAGPDAHNAAAASGSGCASSQGSGTAAGGLLHQGFKLVQDAGAAPRMVSCPLRSKLQPLKAPISSPLRPGSLQDPGSGFRGGWAHCCLDPGSGHGGMRYHASCSGTCSPSRTSFDNQHLDMLDSQDQGEAGGRAGGAGGRGVGSG